MLFPQIQMTSDQPLTQKLQKKKFIAAAPEPNRFLDKIRKNAEINDNLILGDK